MVDRNSAWTAVAGKCCVHELEQLEPEQIREALVDFQYVQSERSRKRMKAFRATMRAEDLGRRVD
jgi:hypothetical protein